MDLSPLSLEELSKVLSEAPTTQALYDTLSQYEDEACLLFTHTGLTGDAKLLSFFYASFLISHLLTDQIEEARALTYRMPPTLANVDPVLLNAVALLRAVRQNQYPDVYEILRQVPWPEPVNLIIQKYDVYFAEKSFRDISRAYEAIRPENAVAFLGLEELAKNKGHGDSGEPSPLLIQTLTRRGWVWDANEHLFRPKVQEQSAETNGARPNGISQLMGLVSGYGG